MVIAYDNLYNGVHATGNGEVKSPFDRNLNVNTQELLFDDILDMEHTHSPHIKHEDDDFYNHNFMAIPQQQFQGQQYMHQGMNMNMNSVNPSELTMGGAMGNGMPSNINTSFGNSNMASNYIVGKSQIADDELDNLEIMDDPNQMHQQQQMFQHQQGAIPMSHQQRIQQQQMYSHTPEGAPIMSPFQNANFDYSQFRGTSLAQTGSYHGKMPQMSRHASDQRSPMTPKLNGLQLGTPESAQFLAQQHNRNTSQPWTGTPGSGSWGESSVPSPHSGNMHHPNMNEVISSGKHASLPAKVEGGPQPNFQTQEAKRRRRRESHNLVERRRRDNINERIQDLSKLVPQHRLEDEKIRKHITANGPLSPGLAASGISPPAATSLLAGGSGRRAAGGITTGLPLDDKEKGPNKGDILNSSVSWTRDTMWLLYDKLEQEKQLKEYYASQGMAWPFPISDDEHRMVSELTEAVQRNGVDNFSYSRYAGSGLRVPKHTNYAGEPVQGGADSPQSLSPGIITGGTGDMSNPDFWTSQTPHGDDQFLKEEDGEDDFGMEMG